MIVVVFGDSIATGQRVSPHLAWVTRVSAALPDDLVVNAGQNGDTTRTALLRMAHDVPPCDVLVVQFGINDANIWASEFGTVRVSEQAFVANLAEIAGRTRGRVIFQTNHRTRKDPEYDARALRYNDLIRHAAATAGAGLVDIEGHGIDLLDGIHPSALGHEQYALAALPAIGRALG